MAEASKLQDVERGFVGRIRAGLRCRSVRCRLEAVPKQPRCSAVSRGARAAERRAIPRKAGVVGSNATVGLAL
jgi:hypothetical protein